MPGRKVLIVESHEESRKSLASALKKGGFDVFEASSEKTALPTVIEYQVDAIITELKLADGDGLRLLNYLKINALDLPVIFVTAFATMSSAIQAMKMGAADFLSKPVSVNDITEALTSALDKWDQRNEKELSEAVTLGSQPQDTIIAISPPMRQLLSLAQRIAPYDNNILLCGESGSGKEVLAREIHRLGPRRNKPFVPINCASLSSDLFENELFGHERGAFTGANERKIGVFETANDGILFLDEINEMGPRSQAKLLRALERMEFRRLGGTKKIKINLRLMSATNVSLEDEIKARRFREDLYYRIKVLTLSIPPLRDRKDDIPFLLNLFLRNLQRRSGKSIRRITPEVIARLQSYYWPGNVRELRNVVVSMALMAEGDVLDIADLPQNVSEARSNREIIVPLGMTMEEAEREIIRRYLGHFPTKKDAAKALNIGLRTLFHKIKRYSLPSSDSPAKQQL